MTTKRPELREIPVSWQGGPERCRSLIGLGGMCDRPVGHVGNCCTRESDEDRHIYQLQQELARLFARLEAAERRLEFEQGNYSALTKDLERVIRERDEAREALREIRNGKHTAHGMRNIASHALGLPSPGRRKPGGAIADSVREAFDLDNVDAALQPQGGAALPPDRSRCDADKGPCACGAWHDPAPSGGVDPWIVGIQERDAPPVRAEGTCRCGNPKPCPNATPETEE